MLIELVELRQLRLELDLTYAALATACGLKDNGHVYRLLHGQNEPTERTLYKIRRFLAAHQPAPRRKAS